MSDFLSKVVQSVQEYKKNKPPETIIILEVRQTKLFYIFWVLFGVVLFLAFVFNEAILNALGVSG